jgi:hypothetical protein
MANQQPMDGRASDGGVMEALEIGGDFARAEMKRLAQVQHLADDPLRGGAWRATRRARAVAESRVAVRGVPFFSFIECLAPDPEVATRPGDGARLIARRGQEFGAPSHEAGVL